MSDKDITERLSFSVIAVFQYAQLMRLVHDTIILYYNSHELKVKACGVLKQYQKYLDWQADLLDDVEDIDDDDRMVLDVLSLQSCSCCPFV